MDQKSKTVVSVAPQERFMPSIFFYKKSMSHELLLAVLAGGGPDVQCESSHPSTRVRLELDIESVAVRREHLSTFLKIA